MPKPKPKRVNPVILPAKLAVVRPKPLSETEAFIQLAERAAQDPTIDVNKLQEILAIRDRERDRQAVSEFAISMSAAQSEMEPVRRDSYNPNTKSRYASYQALDRAIRPIYSRHGFALTFGTEPQSSRDFTRVICDVMHRAGHTRRYEKDMPISTKGPKGGDLMTETHASMSADTYAMRNLLRMIWNIATFDDDGNLAGAGPAISAEQLIEIEKLIDETKADLDKFCAYMKISELAALPATQFENAKVALRNVAKKAGRS